MTTASKQAYAKPENQVARQTHKSMCFTALIGEKDGLTSLEVSKKTGLKHSSCWKRLADLHTEGKIITNGTKNENGNDNSLYIINRNPPMFHVKKLTLREFLEKENPALLHKYEVLHEHKL